MAQNAAVGSIVLMVCKSGIGLDGNSPAVTAEHRVVAKKVNASSGTIGIAAQRFSAATPTAQNTPEKRL